MINPHEGEQMRQISLLTLVIVTILCMSTMALAQQDCVYPDLRITKKTLDIPIRDVLEVLYKNYQGEIDLAAKAKKLGITEAKLRESLAISANDNLCGPPGSGPEKEAKSSAPTRTVKVHDYDFQVNYRTFNSFAELPNDITTEREEIKTFPLPEGGTHYYQVVYVPTKNVSWVQAALLAESVGGYLASITSAEENAFVFSLVDDEKYFWEFPEDYTPDSHYGIKIGPFLGGTKVDGSNDSKAGWVWLSGEKWDFENWCRDLDDGVIDNDPRPNDQPNGRGRQKVMGFGELNKPVPYWGDYFEQVSQYENMPMPAGNNYGFIIEWDHKPTM